MAHSDSLPDDVLDAITALVGSEVGKGLGAAALGKRMELTESFSIWVLGADAASQINEDLSRLANPNGRWHHQIKVDGSPDAFARSQPLGPRAADWSLQQLFESPIAKKIDEAIEWVDKNVKGDPLVRLLIVPAYQLHAFWIVEGSDNQVLVVDMPPSFVKLQYQRLYSSKEFLELLLQEQHEVGLVGPIHN